MSDTMRTEQNLSKRLKDRIKKLNKPDWWTITLSEYLDLYRGLQYRDFIGRLYFYTFDHTVAGQSDLRDLTARHRGYIVKCLKEGKPVPKSVLKDYPDLITKYEDQLTIQTPSHKGAIMSQKKSKTNESKSTPKTSQGRGRPVGGSRFTDGDRKTMIAAIANGTSVKDLAEKFNVSVTTIAYQLKKPATA